MRKLFAILLLGLLASAARAADNTCGEDNHTPEEATLCATADIVRCEDFNDALNPFGPLGYDGWSFSGSAYSRGRVGGDIGYNFGWNGTGGVVHEIGTDQSIINEAVANTFWMDKQFTPTIPAGTPVFVRMLTKFDSGWQHNSHCGLQKWMFIQPHSIEGGTQYRYTLTGPRQARFLGTYRGINYNRCWMNSDHTGATANCVDAYGDTNFTGSQGHDGDAYPDCYNDGQDSGTTRIPCYPDYPNNLAFFAMDVTGGHCEFYPNKTAGNYTHTATDLKCLGKTYTVVEDGVPILVDTDTWVSVETMVKNNGPTDNEIELWVNGVQSLHIRNFAGFTAAATGGVAPIDWIRMDGYFGGDAAQCADATSTQKMRQDNLVISKSYIGPPTGFVTASRTCP